ncbi:MAG: N-acetylneuraminate synthase family protein [Planctomycetales bacterium]|nr:N-acetylneuraminate synthase family protein [Planctomycetales bacterium]
MKTVEVIAEIANAHQGDPKQAIQIGRQAHQAGADAVKLQIYSADELLVKSHPRYDHFKKQAFSRSQWKQVFGELKSIGAKIYCDVFGVDALGIAAHFGADGFKLHSSDLNNTTLLSALSDLPGTIFLSAGGSTAVEIGYAIRKIFSTGDTSRRVVLLHGFQSYPTAVGDANLRRISQLKSWFGGKCEVGYMDHVDGGGPHAILIPQMAVAAGASVIEKHVTLDRSAKGVDYYSSIDVDQFSGFVDAIRDAESACGSFGLVFSESERTYRSQMKKHWVTRSALVAGHVLTEKDLVMKRVAGEESQCVEFEKLIGRELTVDVPEEHPLTRHDVRNKVVALIVARSKSQRLPGKATLQVAGVPAIEHLFHRVKQADLIDEIIFCTTTGQEDDPLVALAEKNNLSVFRGPVDNVLERMLGALRQSDCDIVLRITGDDILVDPEYANRAITWHLRTNSEYSDLKDLPSGTEVEIFDRAVLERIRFLANDSEGTEYLTCYVTHHCDQYRVSKVPVDVEHQQPWRLTIDTPEDYQVVSALLESMREQGKQFNYRLDDIVKFFSSNPAILEQNRRTSMRALPAHISTEMDWSKLAEQDH